MVKRCGNEDYVIRCGAARPHQYLSAPVLPVVREQHAFRSTGGARRVRLHRDGIRRGFELNEGARVDETVIAIVNGFMCAPTDEEAIEAASGWTFFIFALSYYGRKGIDAPGTVGPMAPIGTLRNGARLPTPRLPCSPAQGRITKSH